MVSISSLGTVKLICEIFDIFPPPFPVKLIVVALLVFANSIAFITFSEFPLPLNPITMSFFLRKFSSCPKKILLYSSSFAHAKTTGILSESE